MRTHLLLFIVLLIFQMQAISNPDFDPEKVLHKLTVLDKLDPRGRIYFDTLPFSQLVKFEAAKLKEGIEITWETEREANLDYFDLKRSIDGKTFESIYQVKATNTDEKLSSYRYLDEKVYEIAKDATRVYYQLYQVGLNDQDDNIGGTALLLSNDPLANISPQVTPKSPNVAAMQRFGNFPVNYYTGLANVEIPIYDITLGDMTIPVRLQYHTGGHKVTDNASWVGLGWRLSCEYSTTREVRQLRDEGNNGLLGNNLPPDYSTTCVNATTKPVLTALVENTIDGERDLFNYHTPLKSNSFVLTPSSVLFQEADKSKISYTSTSSDITSFTLTDEHGNVYQYSVSEASTLETIDGNTAWHLTEIQSPVPNQKAVFTYFDNGLHDFNYGRYDWESYVYDKEGNPSVNNNANYNQSRSASITSQLLNEIYFPNGKITFIHNTNRQDGFGKMLDAIEVRAYNYATGNYDLLKKYELWHSHKTRSGTTDKVLFLDSVQVKDTTGVRLGSYKMTYNNTSLPSRVSTAQDYWGYFNNKTSNTNLIPKDTIMLSTNMGQPNPDTYFVGGADRSSNESAMQAWILTQLKYPTGGYTDFSYEANKYLDNSTLRTVGGLRIKKMVSYDGKGHSVTRRLKYGSGENGAGTFRDLGDRPYPQNKK